jgi:hypothetical protein
MKKSIASSFYCIKSEFDFNYISSAGPTVKCRIKSNTTFQIGSKSTIILKNSRSGGVCNSTICYDEEMSGQQALSPTGE